MSDVDKCLGRRERAIEAKGLEKNGEDLNK